MASLAIAAAGIALIPGVASAASLASGVVDPGFDPGANDVVEAVAIQADGKILIGGPFTTVKGPTGATVARKGLARFHSTGALDESFDPVVDDAGAWRGVGAIEVERDGDIVIGGSFASVGGEVRNGLARVSPAGVLDPGFNPGVNGSVRAFAIQEDGGILVGGVFSRIGCGVTCGVTQGLSRVAFARLLPSGAVDEAFNTQITKADNQNPQVNDIDLLPNGRVLIGGLFNCFGPAGDGDSCPSNLWRRSIARVDGTSGRVDETFVDAEVLSGATGDISTPTVRSVAVVPGSGKIVIGGFFTRVGGESHANFARLNADGTVDPSVTAGANDWVRSVAPQADGKILVGGDFTTIGASASNRAGLARLQADGNAVDEGFVANLANGTWSWNAAVVTELQPDGRLLLVGNFLDIVNAPTTVARANAARIGTGSGPAVGPSAVTAAAGNAEATVSWTPLPGEITSYTVTSSPGDKTCTVDVPTTTCTVTGLTNGTEYTFTVAAANEFGTGAASWPSNAVTPTAPVAPVVPGPSGGGSSNAVIPQVMVPAAIAKAGIPVAVNGSVRLPLVCPAGIPGNCDASGVLSMTLPGSVQAERGAAEHAKSRVRTLATFKGVQIASGSTRLYTVRLAPKTYNALRKAGIRRVPADLRTTNRLGGGDPINSQQRIWLKILPLKKAPKVVPVTG